MVLAYIGGTCVSMLIIVFHFVKHYIELTITKAKPPRTKTWMDTEVWWINPTFFVQYFDMYSLNNAGKLSSLFSNIMCTADGNLGLIQQNKQFTSCSTIHAQIKGMSSCSNP